MGSKRVGAEHTSDGAGVRRTPWGQESSGNVFEDIGCKHPQELELRSELRMRILEVVREKGWTQKEAARRMGCTRPDVSRLENHRIDLFSVDRLLRLLRALGKRVVLTVEDVPAHAVGCFPESSPAASSQNGAEEPSTRRRGRRRSAEANASS